MAGHRPGYEIISGSHEETSTMKTIALAVLLAGALAIPAVNAQRGNPPDLATMVQHRVAHLTALLDLLPPQQEQATMIFTNAATTNKGIEANLRTARKQLHTDIQATAPGATVNTAQLTTDANAVATLEGQLQANDAIAEAQLLSILTAAQQMKLSALGEGFGGHGPGGPGGFGGRP
jgi:Spy/CpxP family protein refolding chaperone